jgi:predicted Zn-dependent protease
MRAYLLVLFLLAGCASGPKNEITQFWKPPEQYEWERHRLTGVNLNRRDGSKVFLSGKVIDNILRVKTKIEQQSGVTADLAIAETQYPNAFATIHQGRPTIALSVTFLNELGRDQDALATTIGHELAHLKLAHSGQARKEREDTAQGLGAVLGTAANFVIPFSGYLVEAATTAVARSFTRDEERAADELGLQWASAAGYDPCGKQRTVAVFAKYQSLSIPLLSTHPSLAERSELASEYSRKAGKAGCD